MSRLVNQPGFVTTGHSARPWDDMRDRNNVTRVGQVMFQEWQNGSNIDAAYVTNFPHGVSVRDVVDGLQARILPICQQQNKFVHFRRLNFVG